MTEIRSGFLPTGLGCKGRIALRALALVTLLASSGCASIEAYLDDLLAPPVVEEPIVVAIPEPTPEPAPVPPPAPRAKPAPRVARLTPPPERPAPTPATPETRVIPEVPPPPDIKVVGVSRAQAMTLFGNPLEQRDAAPAKIWQYRAGECEVDVYFYLDVARNDFFALHYDVRNARAAAAGETAERCLQRLYSENHR